MFDHDVIDQAAEKQHEDEERQLALEKREEERAQRTKKKKIDEYEGRQRQKHNRGAATDARKNDGRQSVVPRRDDRPLIFDHIERGDEAVIERLPDGSVEMSSLTPDQSTDAMMPPPVQASEGTAAQQQQQQRPPQKTHSYMTRPSKALTVTPTTNSPGTQKGGVGFDGGKNGVLPSDRKGGGGGVEVGTGRTKLSSGGESTMLMTRSGEVPAMRSKVPLRSDLDLEAMEQTTVASSSATMMSEVASSYGNIDLAAMEKTTIASSSSLTHSLAIESVDSSSGLDFEAMELDTNQSVSSCPPSPNQNYDHI